MAKKTAASAEAESNDSVADKIAVFIGQSVGELVNRKNALLKEIAGIDEEMKKIGGRVSKQLGRYMPNIPGITPSEVPLPRRGPGRPKGTGAKKRTRAPMSEETKAKMREAAKKRWAGKLATSGDKVGNG